MLVRRHGCRQLPYLCAGTALEQTSTVGSMGNSHRPVPHFIRSHFLHHEENRKRDRIGIFQYGLKIQAGLHLQVSLYFFARDMTVYRYLPHRFQ